MYKFSGRMLQKSLPSRHMQMPLNAYPKMNANLEKQGSYSTAVTQTVMYERILSTPLLKTRITFRILRAEPLARSFNLPSRRIVRLLLARDLCCKSPNPQ